MKPDTLLFRQINPGWLDDGVVTTQGFKPTAKDEGLLSVDDGNLVTAEDAYKCYTECLGLESAGVLALTVAECDEHCLPVTPDALPCQPSHVVIDFTKLSGNQVRKVAKYLKYYANERGWQYQPSKPESDASPSAPGEES